MFYVFLFLSMFIVLIIISLIIQNLECKDTEFNWKRGIYSVKESMRHKSL